MTTQNTLWHAKLLKLNAYQKQLNKRYDGIYNRGSAFNHRLPVNKGFEQACNTIIESVHFNIAVSLSTIVAINQFSSIVFINVRGTVVVGCNHAFVECIRTVRHIYGILRHKQNL